MTTNHGTLTKQQNGSNQLSYTTASHKSMFICLFAFRISFGIIYANIYLFYSRNRDLIDGTFLKELRSMKQLMSVNKFAMKLSEIFHFKAAMEVKFRGELEKLT